MEIHSISSSGDARVGDAGISSERTSTSAGVSRQELEKRLGIGRVDGDELADVLLHATGRGSGVSDDQTDYSIGEVVALSVRYSRKGQPIAILPGPALTSELLDRIERQVHDYLLAPPKSMVYRFPAFTGLPVEGYWRHGNKVVLRRAPDEAPRPFFLLAPHPLILEIRFDGSNDDSIRFLRAQREPREFALFLSLLVPWLTVPSNVSQKSWVTVMTPDWTPAETVLAQSYYSVAGLPAFAEDFSDQGDLPDIRLVDSVPDAIGSDEVLTLPRNLPVLIDVFMNLNAQRRRKILRAAYWLHHARDVWHLSRSASYQALVQAVEVLIETPPGQDVCSECRRTIGLGPTRLFTQFIDRYAPLQRASEGPARKKLYSTRSQLTHGNTLLYLDEPGFNRHGPQLSQDFELMDKARSICRRAIVEWLASQSSNANEIEQPHAAR